jgi:2-dehydropantoate 2-reductase
MKVGRATAGNRSSMLQDVARGAPTEIEGLNGAVVREGRRLDVPTPVNEWLYTEVLRLTGEKASTTPLSSSAKTAGVKR